MFQKSAFPALKNSVTDRLEKAGEHLTYHNLAHTLDVLEQATRIAESEDVSNNDLLLLKVAALYHDIGYLKGAPYHHEKRSCDIFAEEAEQWKFSKDEIQQITNLIMATRIPQTPANQLERIICDADLDYLGRKDFFRLSEQLKKEFLHFGLAGDERQWQELQLKFLENQRYFTKVSQQTRMPLLQGHLAALKDITALGD